MNCDIALIAIIVVFLIVFIGGVYLVHKGKM